MHGLWTRWGGVLLLLIASVAAADESLLAVTEELPPYNMVRNGRVTGMSTEVVEAVLQQAGLSARIQAMPWARAYDTALHGENILLFSVARTPLRESLLQWIGPIAPSRLYLYSVVGHRIELHSLDDARRYQIGTVKDDVGEQYLIAQGFVVGKNLQSSNKYESNYEKLKLGHIDLWVSNELNAHYLASQSGADASMLLVPSLLLTELSSDEGLYLACSLRTPPQTAERLRVALQTIRANGVYAAIAHKWM